MISEADLMHLFPIPVLNKELDITDEELKEVQTIAHSTLEETLSSSEIVRNYWEHAPGQVLSENRNILENKKLTNIKNKIQSMIDGYVSAVYDPARNYDLYITTSWFSYLAKNKAHNHHTHSNSILSGVLYINTDKEDSIVFSRSDSSYQTIDLFSNSGSYHSAKAMRLPVYTKQLLIFPSGLPHVVHPVDGHESDTRISLSFNTFVRGDIGLHTEATHLRLP
jgi:uncharacterized protein (TIGR02466 family)